MSLVEALAKSVELQQQTRAAGIAFLKTELEISLTFAISALNAFGIEKKNRNEANARKGYNSFMRFSRRFHPGDITADEQKYFEQGLKKLRAALNELSR